MKLLSLLVLLMMSPDKLTSGPDVGTPVPALPAHVAVGLGAGESRDLAAERGGRPTLYVFVQASQLDRPMARLIRVLDEGLAAVATDGEEPPALVAVWLTDDPQQSREFLPRAQQSLKLKQTTWSVFEGPRQGPAGWSINDAAGLTIVTVRDGKVLHSTGFDSWNETDAEPILRVLRAEQAAPEL